MKKPAVFIDRDGTLIEEVNYLSRLEDLRLFPFTASSVELFKDRGFLVIVVTNQSGIGRGIYSEDDMHSVHREIQRQLGSRIDGFYFCPHLPNEGCECRKPNPGMILAAAQEHNVDLERSWIIGDKNIDVATGPPLGLSTALVLTGYGTRHRALLEAEPTIVASDLGSAATAIIDLLPSEIVL